MLLDQDAALKAAELLDDTMFHRSTNKVDHIRYCLFMDIVRPNHAEGVFAVAVRGASVIAGSFKRSLR